jgi:hypothetical protein
MRFLVDNSNKVIFGWSAKCGCSLIKRIFRYLYGTSINDQEFIDAPNAHVFSKDLTILPDDIEKYTTIIISRNPYKRLVSGFLDKYRIGGEFRHLWKYNYITFSMFVNELIKNNWDMVERHHFTPQTSETFNNIIFKSKCIKFYDIENIDYKFIEKLYNLTIPESILQKKEGHERGQYDVTVNKHVYNSYMMTYLNSNVDLKYFYNEELKQKIFKFYKNDFIFFKNVGIDYINETF